MKTPPKNMARSRSLLMLSPELSNMSNSSNLSSLLRVTPIKKTPIKSLADHMTEDSIAIDKAEKKAEKAAQFLMDNTLDSTLFKTPVKEKRTDSNLLKTPERTLFKTPIKGKSPNIPKTPTSIRKSSVPPSPFMSGSPRFVVLYEIMLPLFLF